MLSESLGIRKGITAIVGSGGKTTLMLGLASELACAGKVIICTSTKIERPDNIPVLDRHVTKKLIRDALDTTNVVCVGSRFYPGGSAAQVTSSGRCLSAGPDGDRGTEGEYYKLSTPAIGFNELAKLCDYVLVEADGSKRKPLKAHDSFEPVIPEGTEQLIGVIGLSGIGSPIKDAVHRPEIFCEILEEGTDNHRDTGDCSVSISLKSPSAGLVRKHCLMNQTVTEEMAAAVINAEYAEFAEQSLCTPIIIINQADSAEELTSAETLAGLLDFETFAGSLREGRIRKIK